MRKLCVLLMILMVLLASSAAADVMLTLPSSLIKIEDEAFAGDTSIGTVVLPEGIESIGARAFANSSLTKINLPASISFIGEGAFDGVENMTGGAELSGVPRCVSGARSRVHAGKACFDDRLRRLV